MKLGQVRVMYDDNGKRKSATGDAIDDGCYLRIDLKESKRRKNFSTILLPWHVITKVVVMDNA